MIKINNNKKRIIKKFKRAIKYRLVLTCQNCEYSILENKKYYCNYIDIMGLEDLGLKYFPIKKNYICDMFAYHIGSIDR